jgi:hypothetical protein
LYDVVCPPVIMVGWENIIFIDNFPNKPSIYRGCSFAIFDYQGVTWQWNVTHSSMRNLPRFRFTTWDFRVEIVMLRYFPFSDRPIHIIYLIYIFHDPTKYSHYVPMIFPFYPSVLNEALSQSLATHRHLRWDESGIKSVRSLHQGWKYAEIMRSVAAPCSRTSNQAPKRTQRQMSHKNHPKPYRESPKNTKKRWNGAKNQPL